MTPEPYRWWTFDAGIERRDSKTMRGLFLYVKLGPLSLCAFPPAVPMSVAGVMIELHILNTAVVSLGLWV